MSFLQVVLRAKGGVSSGAEIRNDAIITGLSKFSEVRQIVIEYDCDHHCKGDRIATTVVSIARVSIQVLIERVRCERPDVVIFEGVALLEAVIALRSAAPEQKIIVDFHNVESSLDRQLVDARFHPIVRPFARFFSQSRLQKNSRADIMVGELADALWTCSELDRQDVRKLGITKPISVIPNPIPEWCSGKIFSGYGDDILFVGHLGYPPNKRAVRELCQMIMPQLSHRLPNASLHICGRSPGRKLTRLVLAGQHKLTANPQDLRSAYSQARVVVIPLRDGGGTRIKVLEALAVGCPIVATAKAVEGLGMVPELHYLRSESSEDFVSGLVRIYADSALAGRLATEGKDFVTTHFGQATRIAALQGAVGAVKRAPTWAEPL